jgi:hypothetical protein
MVCGLALVAVAAHARMGKGEGPSRVIFPTQELPLSFSHQKHLAREKMDCAFCHEDAPGSTRGRDNLMPREEACAVCHPIDRSQPEKATSPGQPGARCSLCHPGARGSEARVVVPPPNLKFNHKIHIDRKVRCQTCHGDLLADGVELATRAQLPRMSQCLGCHDSRTAPSKCTTCHLAVPGGRVKTEYAQGSLVPSGVLRGDAHDLGFRTDHARVAENDPAYCANCHRQSFCASCHNGVVKPMDFHGNDYVVLHPIEARRNTPDCSGCHRRQTFCTGCHVRSGVSTDEDTGLFDRQSTLGKKNFHPSDWLGAPGAGHSLQARRNLRACASCHREEFCQDCHSTKERLEGLQTVSPHPVGWADSARCRSLLAKNGRMCLRCHITANEARCR